MQLFFFNKDRLKTFFAAFLFLFFLVFCTQFSTAQRNSLRIDGVVKKEKEKLDGVSITVYQNDRFFAKTVTEGSGKFRFLLNYDFDYVIEFSKPGYVSKKVTVNTEGVPPEDQDFGHEYGGWELSLFTAEDGMDMTLFAKPFVKISYNADLKKFEHDVEYTKLVKEEFEQILEDFNNNKKMEDKRKKEEARLKERDTRDSLKKLIKDKEETSRLENEKIKKQKKEEEAATKAKFKIEQEDKKKPIKAEGKLGKEEKNNNNNSLQKKNENKKITEEQFKTKEEFLQALAKQYPSGMTEEVYMEGNVKITRRIVVEGNLGTEYKMTEHPWGGKFWFKNGIPVNESIWNTETVKKK